MQKKPSDNNSEKPQLYLNEQLQHIVCIQTTLTLRQVFTHSVNVSFVSQLVL